ncbi:MAG: DUF2095 family protein [Candidatus Thorarchaeota archaeon]
MSDEDKFQKAYPALNEELEKGSTQEYTIDGVRIMSEDHEEQTSDEGTFLPNAIDYIRRCDTVPQAIEIVDYLLNRGELTTGQARDIKKQLKSEGLRSFGAKKEKDHYLKHGLE